MKLTDIIRQRYGLGEDDAVGVKATTADVTIDEPQRLVTAIANTAALDLDDEVVLPSGAEMDDNGQPRYMGQAKAIFYNHRHDDLPVGVLRKAQLKGDVWRTLFRVSDKTEFSRDLFSLMLEGAVRGVSIGFVATDVSPPDESETAKYGPARNIIRRWRWLELSVTPMPCNPEAWVESLKTGACVLDDDTCSKVARLAEKRVISKASASLVGVPERTLWPVPRRVVLLD
jgi:hypothetical protein